MTTPIKRSNYCPGCGLTRHPESCMESMQNRVREVTAENSLLASALTQAMWHQDCICTDCTKVSEMLDWSDEGARPSLKTPPQAYATTEEGGSDGPA